MCVRAKADGLTVTTVEEHQARCTSTSLPALRATLVHLRPVPTPQAFAQHQHPQNGLLDIWNGAKGVRVERRFRGDSEALLLPELRIVRFSNPYCARRAHMADEQQYSE
jgi:hypothetical protein